MTVNRYGPGSERVLHGDDRAVLAGDAIFYLHGDDLYTGLWSDPTNWTGPE